MWLWQGESPRFSISILGRPECPRYRPSTDIADERLVDFVHDDNTDLVLPPLLADPCLGVTETSLLTLSPPPSPLPATLLYSTLSSATSPVASSNPRPLPSKQLDHARITVFRSSFTPSRSIPKPEPWFIEPLPKHLTQALSMLIRV